MKASERQAAKEFLRTFLLAALCDIETMEFAGGGHHVDVPPRTLASVRELRIALRRMQYEIEALGPFLSSRAGGSLAGRLRTVAKPLGNLRDMEVLQEQLVTTLQAQRVTVASSWVLARVSADRERAQENADRAVSSRAFRQTLDTVTEFANALPDGDAYSQHLEIVVRRVVLTLWMNLHHAVKRARSAPSDERRHELRIATKRLVYCVEAFSHSVETPPNDFINSLRVLQRRLGRQHDRVVVATWLAKERSVTPTARHLLKSLSHRKRRRVKNDDEVWREAWKCVRRQRHRETWF